MSEGRAKLLDYPIIFGVNVLVYPIILRAKLLDYPINLGANVLYYSIILRA